MAKMYGDIKWHRGCSYGCCEPGDISKRSLKSCEDRQWRQEALEEIDDPPHADGLCKNYKTGMLGCEWCYPDDDFGDGWFGDLEGHDGILYNGKPVIDPWEGIFE